MAVKRDSFTGEPVTKRPRARRQMRFVRPWLYPKQEAFLYTEKRYSIAEASTKSGKTHGCIVWFIETAAMRGGPNRHAWWVAPTYSQAEIAFRRVIEYCPRELIHVNYGKLTIQLPNGTWLWFKTGEKPDSLYGEDVICAVIDEASRVREASWIAIRSTLTATQGPLRIIGNVKGRKNWAYRLARRAEARAPNMLFTRLTAYDAAEAGIFPMSEIEDARLMLPPDVFQELFMAVASEDGSNPFGHDNINLCGMEALAKGPVVAYGVDLARKSDWTVIVGLNKKLEVAYFDRFQRPWPITEDAITKVTRQTPTLLDATGVGDPVTQHVQKKNKKAEGFIYTSSSKPDLILHLILGVQRQTCHFPYIDAVDDLVARLPENDPRRIMTEMREFEYAYNERGRVSYEAAEGLHDDCVNALALAYRMATGGNQVPVVKPHATKVYEPFAV